MAKNLIIGAVLMFILALGTGYIYLKTAIDTPGSSPTPDFVGPGGCRGSEKCREYCREHPDECTQFIIPPSLAPTPSLAATPTPTLTPRPTSVLQPTRSPVASRSPSPQPGFSPPSSPLTSPIPITPAPLPSPLPTDSDSVLTPELIDEIVAALNELDVDAPLGTSGPGGCSTIKQCQNYCAQPNNYFECLNFHL